MHNNPQTGIALCNNCCKIRLAIESKGNGKRGGRRVITYAYVEKLTFYLLSIFNKSEQENISTNDLKEFLKIFPF